jgi:arginine decarboxylase
VGNEKKTGLYQPLVEAMEAYRQEHVYPLHTPGHKGGRGMAEPLRSLLGPEALQLDVSLMAELDDIHNPTGCIAAAQAAAAELYGSDAAFLAVNGTTGAIHAMLMMALHPGDKVLVPRNSHRSVTGGLILSAAVPVFLTPPVLDGLDLQGQPTPDQVEQAFREYPDLQAVVLTSPNYYGMTADVKAIADIAHRHGAVLLVDEAHGPHLGFHADLPPSALQCGADVAAQSTHKILGAMTQCSLLHIQGPRIDRQHAADVVSLLTTTSPNYLLMGSIDAARAQLAADGQGMMDRALGAARRLRRALTGLPGLRVLGAGDVVGRAGITALDETKVTLQLDRSDVTGIALGELLRRAGLAVELVDPRHVLFLVTYADATDEWPGVCRRIRAVLESLPPWQGVPHAAPAGPENAAPGDAFPQASCLSESAVPLRDVFYGQLEAVPLADAAGRICGETVSFYPPGIPVLLPGERITPALLTVCRAQKALGLPVSGPADATLKTLRVLREQRD